MAAFRAFCAEHADQLRELLTTPVALLEIGASAGLNLRFDAYGYRLGERVVTPEGGTPVTLSTTVRGGGPVDGLLSDLLGSLPVVEYR